MQRTQSTLSNGTQNRLWDASVGAGIDPDEFTSREVRGLLADIAGTHPDEVTEDELEAAMRYMKDLGIKYAEANPL